MDHLIAVRLANEGVPVRAIARATQIPSSEVRTALEEAQLAGVLLVLPSEDWPARQAVPAPVSPRINRLNDDSVLKQLRRLFVLSGVQAEIMLLLLRRAEVPYQDIPANANAARVFVHRLRKALKPFNMTVKTLHGFGFYLPAAQQKRALELLQRSKV